MSKVIKARSSLWNSKSSQTENDSQEFTFKTSHIKIYLEDKSYQS